MGNRLEGPIMCHLKSVSILDPSFNYFEGEIAWTIKVGVADARGSPQVGN